MTFDFMFDTFPCPEDGAPPEGAHPCPDCDEVPEQVRWERVSDFGILSGWMGYQARCSTHGHPVARIVLMRS